MLKLTIGLLSLHLSSCQWARMEYRGGAEKADVLACHRKVDDPNAFACWPYMDERLRGGPVREL